jgi:hypothetical protein
MEFRHVLRIVSKLFRKAGTKRDMQLSASAFNWLAWLPGHAGTTRAARFVIGLTGSYAPAPSPQAPAQN